MLISCVNGNEFHISRATFKTHLPMAPGWGPYLNVVVEKSSAVAQMGDRGHNRHGPKRGALFCPFHGGAGFPSNTMWPGPRSTFVPSGVFIHPAVWPQ